MKTANEMPVELEKAEYENFREVWTKAMSPGSEFVAYGFFRMIHQSGFDKCYELMIERESVLLEEIERLKFNLASICDVREQRNRFADKINELQEREQNLLEAMREAAEYAERDDVNGNAGDICKRALERHEEELRSMRTGV